MALKERNAEEDQVFNDFVTRQHYDGHVITELMPLLTGSPKQHAAALGFLRQQGRHSVGNPSSDQDQAQLRANVSAARRFAQQKGVSASAGTRSRFAPNDATVSAELAKREPGAHPMSQKPAQRMPLRPIDRPQRDNFPSEARDPFERN